MADRTHDIDQIDVDTAEIEVTVNEINAAQSPALGFGLQQSAMTGLRVEMYAGYVLNTSGVPVKITSGLGHDCTDDATNYCSLEPGAPPTITWVTAAPSGWPGPLASGGVALYEFVAVAGALTDWADYRLSPAVRAGDVFGPASSVNNRVVFFDGTTGKLIKDSGLTLSGSNTGDQTNITGNAGTATALQTARTIGGVSFDGTANISQPFDASAFYPGAPSSSVIVLRIPVARAISFAANFAGSYGVASAAATGSTAFDITKNGSTIGAATFAGAATTATFTSSGGSAQSLAAGDVLAIVAPASPDATLANPGFVLAGTR